MQLYKDVSDVLTLYFTIGGLQLLLDISNLIA